MKNIILVAIVMLLVAGASPVFADVITTSDGKTIEGRVVMTEGGYDIYFDNGTIRSYAPNDVVSIEFAPALIEQYGVKADILVDDPNADGFYRLALWAHSKGLSDKVNSNLQAAVKLNPEHEKARNALGYFRHQDKWMTPDEIMTAKGFVKYEGSWITESEYDWITEREEQTGVNKMFSKYDLSSLDDEQTIAEIKRLLRMQSDEEQIQFLISGLTHEVNGFRQFCAKELGRFANETVMDSLMHTALLDKKRDVRMQSVSSLQRISTKSNVSPEKDLVKALDDVRAHVRIAATDALAEIGGISGVRTMVRNFRITYAGGARGYVAFLEQLSYIEDYDVQVATWMSVADPIVGVLQTGVVLDCQTLRIDEYIQVVERSIIWGAFKKLGDAADNMPQPESLESFNEWWAKNQKAYE
ncbi:HEAT repeat domain-containing protein [Planctomycetota bacterium]